MGSFGPLVDGAWLRRALEGPQPHPAVVDVRWYPDRPRRTGYLAAHIPGAVYLDVDEDLAGPVRTDRRGGRHPLPTPEAFADAMSRAGIGDGTPVVVYDDAAGSTGARLWWMLRALNHPAAVLDGGLLAWGAPVESGDGSTPAGATFTPKPWPSERTVDAGDVERLREDPRTVVIVDVRAAERYRGDVEPIDPVAGHIPGARSVPWTEVVDPRTLTLLPPDALRARYAREGIGRAGVTAVAHCGSGVTACHALLAFEVAGLPTGLLYVGSWSDWISDPSRPIATTDDGSSGL